MIYRGGYAVLLALHLLTAIFVVGPLAVTTVQAPRAVRAGRLDEVRAALRTTRLYGYASVLVVAFGAALVGLSGHGTARWSMGSAWVSAAWALWLVALGVTLLLVVPAQERAVEQLERGDAAGGQAGRIAAGGGVAMLCWTTIIVLMVVKPGA